MERSRTIPGLLWLLVIALFASPCLATQVRQLNIEDLTRKAGRIVAGRCARVEVVEDADLGRPVTRVTILIDHSLKGAGGRSVTFRMLGDRSGRRRGAAVTGMPTFAPGEDLVLFLYPDSSAGLTSPVGLGQGKFAVAPDKLGRSIAVNAFGSAGLFRGLSEEARGRLGNMVPRGRGRPLIGRDSLVQMIERLQASDESP